jgi:magnesium transporter
VQFLLDAVLGFINTEQNDIFKVLTIASVVGIPPTFIASMYGMNFHNMPELSWHYGYEWGLFLIALSTILPIIWFKWRGWW